MTISARFERGVFKPLEDVEIEEGTIVEVRLPSVAEAAPGRRSIKDLPFYGMWADREDMTDGVGYVDRLRSQLRG